jgi:hypothetical protein
LQPRRNVAVNSRWVGQAGTETKDGNDGNRRSGPRRVHREVGTDLLATVAAGNLVVGRLTLDPTRDYQPSGRGTTPTSTRFPGPGVTFEAGDIAARNTAVSHAGDNPSNGTQ